MRRTCFDFLTTGLLAMVAALAGCSSAPSDRLSEEQLQAQMAAEKESLADEDAAEAEFQKSQRKQRR